MRRGPCQLALGGLPQGGHQHGQEASLQQQGVPAGSRKSTKGPGPPSRHSHQRVLRKEAAHPAPSPPHPQANRRPTRNSHSPLEIKKHLAHLQGEALSGGRRGTSREAGKAATGVGWSVDVRTGLERAGDKLPRGVWGRRGAHSPGRLTGRRPRAAGRRAGGAAGAAAARPGPARRPAGSAAPGPALCPGPGAAPPTAVSGSPRAAASAPCPVAAVSSVQAGCPPCHTGLWESMSGPCPEHRPQRLDGRHGSGPAYLLPQVKTCSTPPTPGQGVQTLSPTGQNLLPIALPQVRPQKA